MFPERWTSRAHWRHGRGGGCAGRCAGQRVNVGGGACRFGRCVRFNGSIIERCVRFEGSGVRVNGSGNGDAWRCDGGNDDIKRYDGSGEWMLLPVVSGNGDAWRCDGGYDVIKRYDGSGEWMLLSVVMVGDNSEKRLPFSQAARTFGVAGCRE